MSTALGVVLCIILFAGGFIVGMFLSVKNLKKHMMKKPPVSRQQISKLMSLMGRKPSAQQLNNMMNSIKNTNQNIKK